MHEDEKKKIEIYIRDLETTTKKCILLERNCEFSSPISGKRSSNALGTPLYGCNTVLPPYKRLYTFKIYYKRVANTSFITFLNVRLYQLFGFNGSNPFFFA